MRDYAVVAPTFWTGETGRAIVKAGPECVTVAMHLMTSPHANAFGHYYIPLPFIAHETGLGPEGASKALQRVCDLGFSAYDHISQVVWVYEMASWQIARELKPADNRVKSVNKLYLSLPKSPFLYDLFIKYKDVFHLSKSRGEQRGFEAPSKPLRSQEQEQEQEQDKKNSSAGGSDSRQPSAPAVFFLNQDSGNHFRGFLESVLTEIKQACETIRSLPEKESPFNPYQAVQKAVNERKHPDAILQTLTALAGQWESRSIKNPWGWWRKVLNKKSQNAWEVESSAKADEYKKVLDELASRADLFKAIGLNIKTIPNRTKPP